MELESREPVDQTPIKLICELYKATTTKDGGTRLVLDCGAESLKAVQRIVELHSRGEVVFAIAAVPYRG